MAAVMSDTVYVVSLCNLSYTVQYNKDLHSVVVVLMDCCG